MAASSSQNIQLDNRSSEQHSLVESVRILSDITRKDIEKSYNVDSTYGTEAYYSNRYGWMLRRTVD